VDGATVDVMVREVGDGVWHARGAHVSWTLITEGDEVTLVDTGWPGDRARVVASLERIGRAPADVAAIVLTHGHPDHLGSAEHFRREHGIPVRAHELEAANVRGERLEQVSPSRLLSMAWRRDVRVWLRDVDRLGARKVERPSTVEVFDGQTLDVPGRPVPVHTPGHTSGHCALHLPDRGVLLAGDAMMTAHGLAKETGPQLLPGFFQRDVEQARASLQLLAPLEADVVVCGHGPAFVGSPATAVDAALAADTAATAARTASIEYGTIIPRGPDEAFAFVAHPENWASFFDEVQHAEAGADWGRPGGHAVMTLRFFGRTTTSELELTEWDPPHRFSYLARQPNASTLTNRCGLTAVPGGTELRGTTEVVVRDGVAGVADRAQLWMLDRAYRTAMGQLPEAAAGHTETRSHPGGERGSP
jgi:glyoxylase-like metal-dependent hydrolase (beta-lactamase superfamily II)